jgi:hypothetical protein
MPDSPIPETGSEPSTAPTGLVDPRVLHPGPGDETFDPATDVTPGSANATDPGAASPGDPETDASKVRPATGMVDPRDGLTGPTPGALARVGSIDRAQ